MDVASDDSDEDDEDEDEGSDGLGLEEEAMDLDLAAGNSRTTGGSARRSNNELSVLEPSPIPVGPPDYLGRRRGTGRAFPTRFVSPSASVPPEELFSGRKTHMLVTRYTLRNDTEKLLIRADGARLNNGQSNPRAGWAFWHGHDASGKQLVCSGRLEKQGPFGHDSIQSSNRAELRAVIAALRFRYWPGEGFDTLIIATDSEYILDGSTKWAKTWVTNAWTTRGGTEVKNRDLWEALLGEIEHYQDEGMAVKFWKIPRNWNTVADAAAKNAAAVADAPNRWQDAFEINC